MKKQFLLTTLLVILSLTTFSQQWLNFPTGIKNNRVEVGDLSITGDSITIEALITLQETIPAPDAYDIVSKHSNIYDCSYLFRPDNFAIKTDSGFVGLASPRKLCFDSTYHVAGTYDGDSIKFFVNGKQVASQHWAGNLFLNNYVTGIGNLTYSMGFNEQFTGYIDEVRLWRVARTPAELTNNKYNLPNPTTQPGLVAYYKFDGSYSNLQGNTAYNGSTFGSQLLNINNPLFNGSVTNNFCDVAGVDEKIYLHDFQVYPNPTNGEFTIVVPAEESKDFHLIIYNLLGAKVSERFIAGNSRENYLADISSQPDGIYFVELKTERAYSVRRIVKQN